MVNGNEVSIAQIADSNSTLYMNGRGAGEWAINRLNRLVRPGE
jgi:hypothetical protein